MVKMRNHFFELWTLIVQCNMRFFVLIDLTIHLYPGEFCNRIQHRIEERVKYKKDYFDKASKILFI